MTEAITCPRCGGRGELDGYDHKGVTVDPGQVRQAKRALREAYALDDRLPDTPSTEDVLVALAAELGDVEFDGAERPA